jgi:hypothetical protein
MGDSARFPTRSDFTASFYAPVLDHWQAATTAQALNPATPVPDPRSQLLLVLEIRGTLLCNSHISTIHPSTNTTARLELHFRESHDNDQFVYHKRSLACISDRRLESTFFSLSPNYRFHSGFKRTLSILAPPQDIAVHSFGRHNQHDVCSFPYVHSHLPVGAQLTCCSLSD